MLTTELVLNKIKKIRKEKFISQEALADVLEVSRSTYARIENGKVPLTVDRLIELSKYLDVPASLLLETEGYKLVPKGVFIFKQAK